MKPVTMLPKRRHYLLHCPRYAECYLLLSEIVFSGVNQNAIVNLMPDYLCGVLMKRSETLSLETNTDIFLSMFFGLLTNPGVSIKTLIPLHTTSIHIQKYLYYISSLKQIQSHQYTYCLSLSHSLSLSLSLSLSDTSHRICTNANIRCYCVYLYFVFCLYLYICL